MFLDRAGIAEMFQSQAVLNQSQHHSEAGGAEAEVPVDLLAQIAADQRPEEGPDVNSHVKYRETGIAAGAAFRIEVADNSADVGLEQPGADDDERQSEEEGFLEGKGHAKMPRGNNRAPDEHRPLLPDQAIGNPSPGQGEEVNQRGI